MRKLTFGFIALSVLSIIFFGACQKSKTQNETLIDESLISPNGVVLAKSKNELKGMIQEALSKTGNLKIESIDKVEFQKLKSTKAFIAMVSFKTNEGISNSIVFAKGVTIKKESDPVQSRQRLECTTMHCSFGCSIYIELYNNGTTMIQCNGSSCSVRNGRDWINPNNNATLCYYVNEN